ncbi:MAG: Gp37 family protein [Dysgonamonadaceae bacterium]|jgi:hypothetical protein|nr:Gp37 family protein [Dysgonamonadaceae bacterium]
MKYENYEKMIIERLKCPELDVRTEELTSAELNRRRSVKPVIFVLYQGSEYEEPKELGVVAQSETMRFDVIIFSRTQRGEHGAYSAFETITQRLLGYREKGMMTPVVFQKFGYVSEMNTFFQYALQCSFTSYIVEKHNNEEPAPLIKQIKNNLNSSVK